MAGRGTDARGARRDGVRGVFVADVPAAAGEADVPAAAGAALAGRARSIDMEAKDSSGCCGLGLRASA